MPNLSNIYCTINFAILHNPILAVSVHDFVLELDSTQILDEKMYQTPTPCPFNY